MRAEALFAFQRRYAPARTVVENLPTLDIVEQIGEQHLFQNLFVQRLVHDREQRFNAPIEIARHQVSRGDIDRRLVVRQTVTVGESVNA